MFNEWACMFWEAKIALQKSRPTPKNCINMDAMARSGSENVEIRRPYEEKASSAVTIDPLFLEFVSNRSEQAFTTLAQKIVPRLLRYLTALGCKRDEAEDLTQDVLCTFSRKAHAIREPQYMWAWIYKVAHNALLQSVRRGSRQVQIIDIEEVEKNILLNLAMPSLREHHGPSFADWMTRLEIGEQQVMVLRFVEDCDYSEIAQILDIPIGTVKSRIFQAKKKLTKHLSASSRQAKRRETVL